MEASTGNYSGTSSSAHPPSLYDTSVSSASPAKSSWRNATPANSSYRRREDLQYSLPNQHRNDRQHAERSYQMYPNPSRSMDNLDYRHSVDVAAMSDPGGPRFEQNFSQRRSQIEYARSDVGSRPTSYYESQPQLHKPPRYSKEERHSRDLGTINRSNEGYYDGMFTSSPSYHERSHASSSPMSNSNVKDLKRQLWNNNEVLKVKIPSSPEHDRRIQQSLSPTRQPRRQPPTSQSHNLPRFARSLSPRRRQYQHSSPSTDGARSQIQTVSSTVSETSNSNRFHSKFYEAAMVAQKRVDGRNEAVIENDVGEPQQLPTHQHHERRWRISSPPPMNGNNPNDNSHRNLRYESLSSPSQLRLTSSRANNASPYAETHDYSRRSSSGVYTSPGKFDHDTYRPPIIPPSPMSSFASTVTNDGHKERHQQNRSFPADRGRVRDSSPYHGNDRGRSRRRRSPSPLLLDRIRSFDQEYHNDAVHVMAGGQWQNAVGHNSGHLPNDKWRSTNHHSNEISNGSRKTVVDGSMNKSYIDNEGNFRSPRKDDRNNVLNGNGISHDVISSGIGNRHKHVGPYQSEQGRSYDNTDEIEKDRTANLVDKLTAVSRENPQRALAQIDMILKQESRSSHTRSFEKVRDDNAEANRNRTNGNSKTHAKHSPISNFTEKEYERDETEDIASDSDDDDDDSSDVSSITNPTFQQGIPKSSYSKNIDKFYIRENDHYTMHNSNQNSNIGDRNAGDLSKSKFGPSTSSFRRPRPSQLQNYSKDISKDPKTMSRSERKRQEVKKNPPPSTIKVKDGLAKDGNPRQSSADIREKMLQKNMIMGASNVNKSYQNAQEQEKLLIANDKPKKKKSLNKFISDKQIIAEKIRGWDELSNQLSNSQSEREENTRGYQKVGAFSKHHPWNSNTNMVQTKETSMDNAIGVEIEISSHGRYNVEDETSIGGSRNLNENQEKHFQKARNKIKERSDRNPFNDHSVDSIEQDASMRAQHVTSANLDPNNSNLMQNIDVSMAGIPQFNPSEKHQSEFEDENRKKKNSDSKGTSWVSIPPSSYFPDINDDYEPVNGKKSHGKDNLSKSLGTGGEFIGVNQAPADSNKQRLQTKNTAPELPSISRLACKTLGTKEPKLKEKKRGKLRAFMKKKKSKDLRDGYAASAIVGSISDQSTSVESRGVKSASQIYSSDRPNASPSIGNFRVLPPPPGVLDGNQSASARRHRTNDSEKFRSSSMAKKFSRVMQLYDSDET